MKKRISAIFDTKTKKIGAVIVSCAIVLTLGTGAALAATNRPATPAGTRGDIQPPVSVAQPVAVYYRPDEKNPYFDITSTGDRYYTVHLFGSKDELGLSDDEYKQRLIEQVNNCIEHYDITPLGIGYSDDGSSAFIMTELDKFWGSGSIQSASASITADEPGASSPPSSKEVANDDIKKSARLDPITGEILLADAIMYADLSNGEKLQVPGNEIANYQLFTNSKKITVSIPKGTYEGTFLLYDVRDSSVVQQFTLDQTIRSKTFTNLTSATNYYIVATDIAAVTIQVTD